MTFSSGIEVARGRPRDRLLVDGEHARHERRVVVVGQLVPLELGEPLDLGVPA